MEHGLLLDGLLDRPYPIPQPGRLFELQALGVKLHLLAHRLEQFEVASLHQHYRGVQMALVFVAVNRQAARPQASLDLILQAGARAIAKDRVGTGAQGKDLADYVDGFAQSVG